MNTQIDVAQYVPRFLALCLCGLAAGALHAMTVSYGDVRVDVSDPALRVVRDSEDSETNSKELHLQDTDWRRSITIKILPATSWVDAEAARKALLDRVEAKVGKLHELELNEEGDAKSASYFVETFTQGGDLHQKNKYRFLVVGHNLLELRAAIVRFGYNKTDGDWIASAWERVRISAANSEPAVGNSPGAR